MEDECGVGIWVGRSELVGGALSRSFGFLVMRAHEARQEFVCFFAREIGGDEHDDAFGFPRFGRNRELASTLLARGTIDDFDRPFGAHADDEVSLLRVLERHIDSEVARQTISNREWIDLPVGIFDGDHELRFIGFGP